MTARPGKPAGPNLDYDLLFIPAVKANRLIRTGMGTEAESMAPAESGTLLPGGQW